MRYAAKYPNKSIQKRFEETLTAISAVSMQDKIMEEVEKLEEDPRPFGHKLFRQLNPPMIFYERNATCRIRIGDHRVLYDVDDHKKIVWILALRKRSETTYK
jgi:mRNA-degrading endonuclease RelE of RelBE toxin-antitoxin system